MFGSKQYAWCDLSIAVGGKIINGATELEYTEKQEKEPLYGRGSKPHGMVVGNKTYDGKLSMWQSELESMTQSAPDKDVLALEFDIIASYVPTDGGTMVTDVIKKAQFTEVKKALKQGDKNMIIELPIVFIDVKRQQ